MTTRNANQRPPQPIRTPQDNVRDYVRTDIRIHCDTEPLIKKTLASFDINEREFKRLFAKKAAKAQQSKKKKNLFTRKKDKQETSQQQEVKRPQYYLKSMVAVQISLSYNNAQSADFAAEIEQLIKQQQDLQAIEQENPDIIQSFFNFDKQLTPSRALDLLQQLHQETESAQEEIESIEDSHRHSNQKLLKQLEDIQNNLDKELKEMGIILTKSEIRELTKALGGFTP